MNRTYNIVPARERNLDKYNTIGIHVQYIINNHDTMLRNACFMHIKPKTKKKHNRECVLGDFECMFNATSITKI